MPRKANQNPNDWFKVFPVNLRNLMEERGVTQSQLADAVGVTRQAISLYANGQSNPDISTFTKIAKYFEVSADFLLGLSTIKDVDGKMELKQICAYTGLDDNTVRTITLRLAYIYNFYREWIKDKHIIYSEIPMIKYINRDIVNLVRRYTTLCEKIQSGKETQNIINEYVRSCQIANSDRAQNPLYDEIVYLNDYKTSSQFEKYERIYEKKYVYEYKPQNPKVPLGKGLDELLDMNFDIVNKFKDINNSFKDKKITFEEFCKKLETINEDDK